MDLKLRKRVINRYDGGKPEYVQIGGYNHPKYITPMFNNGNYLITPVDNNSNLQSYNINMGNASPSTLVKKSTYTVPDYSDLDIEPIDTSSTYLYDTMTSGGNSGYWGNVVTSGINFAGLMVNDFNSSGVKRENEILGDAGTSYAYANGVAYQLLNNVNQLLQIREINAVNEGNAVKSAASGAAFGAAVGSVVPGLGTVAGGLIGGAVGLIGSIFGAKSKKAKLRKRIYNAQLLANRTNTFNRASAFTKGLQQDYYQQNADESGGILYANKGKDLKKPKL